MKNDELMLVLITSQTERLRLDEFVRLLRHRYILWYLIVPISLLSLTNARGNPDEVVTWVKVSIFVGGTLAFLSGVVAILWALRRVIRRPGPLRVHLSPVMLLATVFSTTVGEVLSRLLGGAPSDTALRFGALVLFFWLAAELHIALAAYFVMPQALAELRAGQSAQASDLAAETAGHDPIPARPERPAPSLTLVPPAPDTAPAPLPAPPADPAETAPADLDLAAVLHLEADGNFVRVTTAEGTRRLAARFSALVQALPDGGRVVHRSHWVAERAVRGWRRDGRDIVLRLADGSEVAIAQSRQAELRGWLDSLPRL